MSARAATKQGYPPQTSQQNLQKTNSLNMNGKWFILALKYPPSSIKPVTNVGSIFS